MTQQHYKQGQPFTASDLRAARRPKPLSLKQQALEAFEVIKLEGDSARIHLKYSDWKLIRRALEALPENECGTPSDD